ncbi:ATP-binding protein [Nonomuraea sp. NPDC049421]|uniref:sensor histidine kinase n=1 Tax=Nonomuraea sp. NPDC049421 TaxID=3155275 RepID=UPI003438DC80
MSVHASKRPRFQTSPMGRALLYFLAAALISSTACGWLVTRIPAEGKTLVGVGSGGAVALFSIAVAVAAYCSTTARESRDRLRRTDAATSLLQEELKRLTHEILPALGHRIRNGATVPGVLAEMGQPSHPATQALVQSLAQTVEGERQRRAAAVAACTAMEAELGRLADEQLPALLARLHAGKGVGEPALPDELQPSQKAVQRLWEEIARELEDGNRQGAAAMASCAEAAARIQAQVTGLLGRLRELEDEYGEHEAVFAHLLEMDHRISQMGRLADNIALLSGGRSGRRWTKPISMESVLRGAAGRIGAFRRVQLHSTSTAAVVGYAAEGVIHALAELIDNAAKFSPPGTAVHVYVEEEDAGVVVTIEDSGLGMRTRERRLAESLISRPLDLTTLSGTRLGLAVVGRLAGKYGLTVSFRPSARGGIGVVVLIARQLVVYPPVDDDAPGRLDPRAEEPVPARHAAPPPGEGPDAYLPKRPRGGTLATAQPLPAQPPARMRDPQAAADRLAAFRRQRTSPADDDLT